MPGPDWWPLNFVLVCFPMPSKALLYATLNPSNSLKGYEPFDCDERLGISCASWAISFSSLFSTSSKGLLFVFCCEPFDLVESLVFHMRSWTLHPRQKVCFRHCRKVCLQHAVLNLLTLSRGLFSTCLYGPFDFVERFTTLMLSLTFRLHREVCLL